MRLRALLGRRRGIVAAAFTVVLTGLIAITVAPSSETCNILARLQKTPALQLSTDDVLRLEYFIYRSGLCGKLASSLDEQDQLLVEIATARVVAVRDPSILVYIGIVWRESRGARYSTLLPTIIDAVNKDTHGSELAFSAMETIEPGSVFLQLDIHELFPRLTNERLLVGLAYQARQIKWDRETMLLVRRTATRSDLSVATRTTLNRSASSP